MSKELEVEGGGEGLQVLGLGQLWDQRLGVDVDLRQAGLFRQ